MRKTINGLAVHITGSAENPPITFVHGFPFDHSMWNEQVETLKDKYYCITYDIRGLGDSYIGDGQFTMEAFALDLFSILNDLGIQKTALCGLSMGGYIALRAVQKDQSRFSELILLDTKAEADSDAVKLKRAEHIDTINTQGLSAFIDQFVTPLFGENTRNTNPKLVESTMERCNTHDAHGVKGSILAMLSRTSTDEFLREIGIPVFLAAGEDDKLTTPEIMKAMSDKIPNSKFSVVPNAGHLSALENPKFVNEKLMRFIP